MDDLVLSVSDFIAVFNQTVEYAYPNVSVTGELSNFRVSKNRWVYFDLKDETSTLKFFGTIYQLPGPLEDGMLLQVKGMPRLHPQYGFSVTVVHIQPTGEGSIKKASELLRLKLEKEGLFDISRKRTIPYPPRTIGLITSYESAAFHDFMKIINNRWRGIEITLADVQVQGESAVEQIVKAFESFNMHVDPPDVIVLTRGGGSSDDLQAFNTEQITRAVSSSRIPTVVAIGHEVDVSLVELAADRRASTPSNAAEILVPDRRALLIELKSSKKYLLQLTDNIIERSHQKIAIQADTLSTIIDLQLQQLRTQLNLRSQIINAFSPKAALERGFALVRRDNLVIRDSKMVSVGSILDIELKDAFIEVETKRVKIKDDHE